MIAAGALEDFIRDALDAAAQNDAASRKLGVRVTQVECLENGNVHAFLSDGSRFYIEINHMVPRGYFDAVASRSVA